MLTTAVTLWSSSLQTNFTDEHNHWRGVYVETDIFRFSNSIQTNCSYTWNLLKWQKACK